MTTIGVAVAVPDPWGSQLQDYRVALGDDAASSIPTHITLLPPVDVDEDLVPTIGDHLASVAATSERFTVRLRGTGTFRPVSPVVFVNVVEGIAGCEVLAAAVRRGPLAIDVQFPYHPHVTIAHHLADEALDRAFEEQSGFDCRFEVTHFVLYTHRDEEGWIPSQRFVLSGD